MLTIFFRNSHFSSKTHRMSIKITSKLCMWHFWNLLQVLPYKLWCFISYILYSNVSTIIANININIVSNNFFQKFTFFSKNTPHECQNHQKVLWLLKKIQKKFTIFQGVFYALQFRNFGMLYFNICTTIAITNIDIVSNKIFEKITCFPKMYPTSVEITTKFYDISKKKNYRIYFINMML